MIARKSVAAVMTAARCAPSPSDGFSSASASTKPFESEASEVTRAIQFIQPVSKPTKSPNAERAYRYAPPGSFEVTGRLGEIQHEDEHGNREQQRRPERERPEQRVRLVRQEEHAGADHGVDAHGHETPEADGADEFVGRRGRDWLRQARPF
jgi:hypothetical protein